MMDLVVCVVVFVVVFCLVVLPLRLLLLLGRRLRLMVGLRGRLGLLGRGRWQRSLGLGLSLNVSLGLGLTLALARRLQRLPRRAGATKLEQVEQIGGAIRVGPNAARDGRSRCRRQIHDGDELRIGRRGDAMQCR
ncbi:hypothetical protein GGI35DRAFT_457535 [Trichoderma velutinum]